MSSPDIEFSVLLENNIVSVFSSGESTVTVEADTNIVEIVSAGPQGPAGLGAEEELYDMEIDSSNPSAVYIGYASPGTAKSSASWRIKKVSDSGTSVSVEWAGGTANFVNIWDNRASYTYGP